MLNLCQKTAKIGENRPCGVQHLIEISKTNFLNIERVKHNYRKYFTPSSYFGTCISVIIYVKFMQKTTALAKTRQVHNGPQVVKFIST